jgi:hypothetical protein
MVGVTVTAGSFWNCSTVSGTGVSENRREPVCCLAALIDPVASAISIGLRLANDMKLILEISGSSALEIADNTSGSARAASDTTSDVDAADC